MEQNTNKAYQSVTDNLRKLRGLSEDEISEEGLLKSRIEQQSELICILKQRADEYLKKYMEIENKTANLRGDMDKANQNVKEKKKSYEVLKDRFDTLDKNHKEMIKLKDEYKADNERLKRENLKLTSENSNLFNAPLEERNAMIEGLNSEIVECNMKLKEAEGREMGLMNQLEDVKRESEDALDKIKLALEKETANHAEAVDDLQQNYSLAQKELSEIQTRLTEREQQREALEEKSEVQGRLLKVQETKLNDLKKQLDREQDRTRQLELKFKKDSESLNTNSTIRRLNNEIQEAQEFKTKIIREFDAYKKHTTNLLNKEKELNSKLRRFNIR